MEQSATSGDLGLSEAAEVVRQYGNHAGRHVFAGVRVDAEAGVLMVYRVPTQGFDEELTALVGDSVRMVIVDAGHTRSALMIAREVAWGIQGDFEIESVVIPDDGSRIRVFVTGSEWDAQAQLDLLVPGQADVMVTRRDRLAAPAFAGADRRGRS